MDIIRVGIHVHQPLLRVLFFHLIKICCSLLVLFFCLGATKTIRRFPVLSWPSFGLHSQPIPPRSPLGPKLIRVDEI